MMKKLLTLLSLCFALAITEQANSQVTIYQEDFESPIAIPNLPAGYFVNRPGGADDWETGTAATASSSFWTMPATSQFAFVNDDSCNCNMSTNVMFLPAQNFTTYSRVQISFNSLFQDGNGAGGNIAETANLVVSTNGGFSWGTVQTLTGSATWDSVIINLNAYAGLNNVLIGFEFDDEGNWAYGWAVDDILIIEPLSTAVGDVQLNAFATEYSSIPLAHVGATAPWQMNNFQVENTGSDTLKGVTMTAELLDDANTIVYTSVLTGPSEIVAGQTETYADPGAGYTPTDTAVFTWRAIMTSLNGNTDTGTTIQVVDDSLYSRDGALFSTNAQAQTSIGDSAFGILGHNFEVTTSTQLASVEAFFNGTGNVGDSLSAVVYATGVGGQPDINNIIAQSPYYIVQAADTPLGFREFFFPDTVILNAGTYFIGITEDWNNGMELLYNTTDGIITPASQWASVNGAAFVDVQTALSPRTAILRANFTPPPLFATMNLLISGRPLGEYTIVPETQVQPLNLDLLVINNTGSDSIRGINITSVVRRPNGTAAYLPSIAGFPWCAPGAFEFYTEVGSGFTPNDTGLWEVEFIVSASNVPTDTLLLTFFVDDSLYARDFLQGVQALGTGGVGSTFGNNFDINAPTGVASVEVFFNGHDDVGDSLVAHVYGTTAGQPDYNNLIASSTPYIVSAADTPLNFREFFFPTTPFLTAGEYHVAIEQVDTNNLALWFDSDIYTANNSYYRVGTGAATEISNAGFGNIVPLVRLNIAPPPPTFDADITAFVLSEYTGIPLDHVTQPFTLSCEVENLSTGTMTGINVSARVYEDGTNNLVYTATMPTIGALPVSSDSIIDETSGGWTPTDTGIYYAEFIVSISQIDVDATNDTARAFIHITEDWFARDASALTDDEDYNQLFTDGFFVNSLGAVNAGDQYNGGNIFESFKTERIVGAQAFVDNLNIGDQITARVYNLLPGGVPDSNFVFESATVIAGASDTGGALIDFDFTGDTINAVSGSSYFLAIHEFPSTDINIAYSDFIAIQDRAYVNVNEGAFSELFGIGFQGVFGVRAVLDDVVNQTYDADVTRLIASEYGSVPKTQVTQLITNCVVDNLGTDTITNVTVTGRVLNPSNAVVYTGTYTPVAAIASGDQATFIDGGAGYTPDTNNIGLYTVEYIVSITQTDADPLNDTSRAFLLVDDSLYARDNAVLFGANTVNVGLGFNGADCHYGNIYDITTTTDVVSVEFFVTGLSAGDEVGAEIFAVNAGVPDETTSLGSTGPYIATAADVAAGFFEVPIQGKVTLPPGEYLIAMDSRTTTANFFAVSSTGWYLANHSWANVNNGPFAEVSTFTTARTWLVRPNLATTGACGTFNISEAVSGDTCAAGTGEIALTVTGGAGTLSYAWSNSGTTSTISNLSDGSYTVTITDASNCDTVYTTSVSPITQSNILTAVITDANCGSANGAITLTNNGFPGTYGYVWSNSAITQNISSIASGNYTVVATGPYVGCVDSATFSVSDIGGPSIDTMLVTDVTCNGDANGSIVPTVTGGSGPLTYSWSTSASSTSISSLNGGLYQLTVTDSTGCQAFDAAVVNEPLALSTSISIDTAVTCFGDNNGQLSVSVSGGTTNYSYSWTGGGNTATISNLAAGTYNLTVTDANNCTITDSETVPGPTAALNATIGVSIDPSCPGGNDGQASVTATGGTGPYNYSWNTSPTQSTSVAAGLTSGTFVVTVTDNNGCTANTSTTLNDPAAITVVLDSVVQPTCNGDSDGRIVVTGGGGAGGPYTYSIPSLSLIGPTFINLGSGNFTVRVQDANNCRLDTNVVLAEPGPIGITQTSASNDTCLSGIGALTVSVAGGNGGYSYAWSDAGTTAARSNITGGSYGLTVTDSKGCTQDTSFNLTNVDNPISVTSIITQPNCGASNGAVDITVSGFSFVTYAYSWSNGPTTQDISSIPAGFYEVIVTDATYGCRDTSGYAVNDNGAPSIDTILQTNNLCFGDTTGTAAAVVTGGSPAYTFGWNTGSTDSTLSNLGAGTYVLTVTDVALCVATKSVTITHPAQLTASVSLLADVTCNGGNDGSLDVTAAGGTGVPTYSWSSTPAQNTAIASNLTANTYTVTVTDGNACTVTAQGTVSEPTAIANFFNKTDATCFGDTDGQLIANASGGSPAYTYLWSTTPPVGTISANNLAAGPYTLTITDANGCTAAFTDTIVEPDQLVVNLVNMVPAECSYTADGQLTAVVNGGTPAYGYLWNSTPPQTDSILDNVAGGNYICDVTDANGCTASDTADVFAPSPITVTVVQVQEASSFTANDGFINITATGGTIVSDYNYQWSDGSTDEDLLNVGPGNYDVTVTDDNGCTATAADSVGFITGIPNIGDLQLFDIYPNPTMGAVNITVELDRTAEITVEVFDVLGERLVATEPVSARKFKQEVNLAGYAAGVYLARVTIGDQAITRRIVLNR